MVISLILSIVSLQIVDKLLWSFIHVKLTLSISEYIQTGLTTVDILFPLTLVMEFIILNKVFSARPITLLKN